MLSLVLLMPSSGRWLSYSNLASFHTPLFLLCHFTRSDLTQYVSVPDTSYVSYAAPATDAPVVSDAIKRLERAYALMKEAKE